MGYINVEPVKYLHDCGKMVELHPDHSYEWRSDRPGQIRLRCCGAWVKSALLPFPDGATDA